MGLGSNLLVSDLGFRGVVIRSNRYNLGIEAIDATQIRVGSSVPISMLLRKAITQGWDGLEFLAGVPGSVGGIVTMNAGTHLGETRDALLESEVFHLRGNEDTPRRYSGETLRYSYRTHHYLPEDAFITSAILRVKPGDPATIKATIDATLERRKKSQPVDQPSCGSVFKNPIESGMKSWQVMEKLGLRGKQIGQAQFSNLHSNFIVNLGGAKAQDVRALIELAKHRARDELGVSLHEEVKYLGEF
jgi:UDP-N-acetylmuramate dehydrogenase